MIIIISLTLIPLSESNANFGMFDENLKSVASFYNAYQVIDFEGDLVGVFVDDKCRGIAKRMYFPFDDRYMYIIQVYSNVVEGEKLHFKYHDSVSNEVIEFEETLTLLLAVKREKACIQCHMT